MVGMWDIDDLLTFLTERLNSTISYGITLSENEYDWEKLDYLRTKFIEIRHRIPPELIQFKQFFRQLS